MELYALPVSDRSNSRSFLTRSKTVLVPQPSDDPNDPLNWSPFKKHAILITVALAAFLGDFGSAAGVACINVQGAEWGLSPNHVNYAGNLNVIML
jgi:hypothetical protein